jgi:glyoxylase-like metal-dependent hydrolase (beta-lactamase superfamily II)
MTARIDQFSSPAEATDRVNVWIVGEEGGGGGGGGGSSSSTRAATPRARSRWWGDREVLAVICTHGHADQVAAAIELAARDEAPESDATSRLQRIGWGIETVTAMGGTA